MSELTLFLIAGEPSGDRLGASLMKGLKTISGEQKLRFFGVGGPLMEQEGLTSLFPMSDLSVMGIAEVLPRLFLLLRRVRETAEEVEKIRPDALITIDSPDFCLRVAKRVRPNLPDTRFIHYVAPSVWAWRPGRAAKMAKSIDHVLTLLPFEPPYMEAAGMSADFVGHPVVAEPVSGPEEISALRNELAIEADRRLITVLPGSRAGEVKRMEPVLKEVAHKLHGEFPDAQFIMPATLSLAGHLSELVKDWQVPLVLLDPRGHPPQNHEARKRTAFAASHLALATSGTVSLELAAQSVPMAIGYKFNALSTFLAKRLVKTNSVTLVNIITDSLAVPEFLMDRCLPELITEEAILLLRDEGRRTRQIDASRKAMQMLGRGTDGVALWPARSVFRAIGTKAEGRG